jgi:hypothetical protein
MKKVISGAAGGACIQDPGLQSTGAFRARQPHPFHDPSIERKIEGSSMKHLTSLILHTLMGGLLLATASSAFAAGWYNTSWTYRKAITIDHTKVPNTDQASFPVLVSLTSDAGLSTHARTDGYDILFTSSDGTTKIPYEREQYTNTSSGTLVAWVNVASLSHLTDTVIYMYYGNASATDQQAATSVWDSNYKGVWHLKENPRGTAPQMIDSTAGANSGTTASAFVAGDQQSAKIGLGLHFGGLVNYDVSMANQTPFNFQYNNPFTIEYWSKPVTSSTGKQAPVSKAQNSGVFPGYEIGHNVNGPGGTNTAGKLRMILVNSATGTKHQIVVSTASATKLNDGSWHHYIYTYSGSGTAAGVKFYQDGVALSTTTDEDDLASNSIQNSTPVHFGSRENGGLYYNGLLDEVRISAAVRTPDWIASQYNNQNSPSTFYALGTEQAISTTTSVSSSLNPSTYSQSVTFTATVTGSGGTPTGTVTFKDGSTTLGTGTLSSGQATFSLSSLSAGSHSITAQYAGDGTFGASTGTLSGGQTVNRAALSITALGQAKTYGQTVTFGSGSSQFTSTGLQNSETIGSVTLAVSGSGGAATASVSGSPYTITPSAATGGSFNPNNYAITYNTGTLTVNKAALSITANADSKTYGQTRSYGAGSTAFTSSGLQNGETIGTVTLAVSGDGGAATASVSGSPYTITPSAATGGTFTAGNYTITYVNGTLTVTRATLTVTADNKSRAFGTANPPLTASFSGFAVGDDAGVLLGAPLLSTTATDTSPGGSYPITVTQGTLLATNYTFTFVDGILTVTNGANTAPTIEGIPDQTVIEDQPTIAYQLAVSDAETPALSLQLSGTSSDTNVVPNENIFLGSAGTNLFFTVTPAFGRASGTSTITITVSDGTNSASTSFLFTVNPPPPGAARFNNPSPISIPSSGTATPYPSQVTVAGRNGTITNMTLVLNKFSHARVQDVNMLLVGPAATGPGVVIMSHVSGDNRSATNVTVFLTDSSQYPLPDHFALWSEPLTPTAYSPPSFPGIPAGVTNGPVAFSTFNGMDANGTWSLYVYDDSSSPAGGSISGGWSLIIGTTGGGNIPPEISNIADQTILINTNTGPIPFVIGDVDTPVAGLTLSVSSSNTTLVPTNNIVFGGSGTNRTITVTPAADQSGTATITVSVNDGTTSTTSAFALTVISVPPPFQVETSALGNGTVVPAQSIHSGNSITVYAIQRDASGIFVGNAAADSWSLTNVTGGVVDGDLVPAGDGKSATFTANAAGTAVIHATLSGLPDANSGTLTAFVNAPPTIGDIGNQSTYEDQPTELVPVLIGDVDTPAINLTLSATSSNTNVVPVENIFFYDYDFANHTSRSISVVPAFGQTGACTISIIVSDGTSTATNNFLFTVNPPPSGSARFANPTPIIIPTQGMATPYPSQIVVSNMSGTISKLQVTISQFWHNFPGDVDMLLVSPAGQKMVIWSRAGDSSTNSDFLGAATNITATLDDAALFPLPYPYPFISIPFTPADYSTIAPPAASFPAPAPSGPYDTPVAMSDFNGVSPNGTWSLYVYDFAAPDQGAIEGGWSLMIATVSPPIISGIVDQSTPVNTTTPAIPFTIGDAQTAASNLVLTVTSSNPALVPTNNIVFGGSDTNRTVTLTPLPNQTGSSTITVTVTDGDGMTTNDSFVLTVSPAQLTVTIDSFNRAYGATNPMFTGSISGLQPGDDIGLSLSTVGTPANPVGSYAIVPTFLDPSNRLGNYIVITNGGTLTVTPAPLTVSANSTSKTYGQTLNFAGTEFGASGLVNGDSVVSVSLSSSGVTATAAAGTYDIVPSGAVGTGLANYTIGYANGTLTVGKASLTVSANNQSKVYGQALSFAGTEFGASGLVNGDSVASVSLSSSGATATAAAGTYDIVPSGVVGTGLANYTIGYANGTLIVGNASLTVSADDQSRAYGATNPVFTVSYSGFASSDDTNVLSGSLDVSTSADTNSVVAGSPYVISVTNGTLSAANYDFVFVAGQLTVTPAVLTVTADNQGKLYGAAVPALTVSYSGFVNGEDTNVLTGAPDVSTTATQSSSPNTYPIHVSAGTLSDANYNFSFVDGTLTVSQPLQVGGAQVNQNQFSFTFATVAGQTYQVEYSDSLNSATWTPLGGPITGTGNSVGITNGITSPQRFFRLNIQQ